jgi:hypothetical protein
MSTIGRRIVQIFDFILSGIDFYPLNFLEESIDEIYELNEKRGRKKIPRKAEDEIFPIQEDTYYEKLFEKQYQEHVAQHEAKKGRKGK